MAEPGLEPVQPVLPAGKGLVVGAYVLDKEQSAAGFQHAAELAERARLIVDGANHERRHGDVETVVLERQVLGWSAQEQRPWRAFPQPPLKPVSTAWPRMAGNRGLAARFANGGPNSYRSTYSIGQPKPTTVRPSLLGARRPPWAVLRPCVVATSSTSRSRR